LKSKTGPATDTFALFVDKEGKSTGLIRGAFGCVLKRGLGTKEFFEKEFFEKEPLLKVFLSCLVT